MSNIFLIFQESILPIFFILAIAFAYNRFFRPNLQQFTEITLLVFAPIFVFESLISNQIALTELFTPLVFMVFLTSLLILIAYLVGRTLKLEKQEAIPLILASSMINIGNFGLPLIFFTFGQKAVTFSVIYFVVFNIPLSTLAIYLNSNKSNFWDIINDILKIPIFHALVLALAFGHFGWSLPTGIDKGMTLISKGAIPLLIFILGLQLSQIQISKKSWRVFFKIIAAGVAIRLVCSPILAEVLLRLIPMGSLEHKVALVQTSGPAALLPLMYAIKFKQSPELLASLILFTTLLAGISLPVLITLIS